MWWSRGDAEDGVDGAEGAAGARARRVPAADTSLWLARLACGARYRVTLQAHNAVGASRHSAPLVARTRGDSESPPTLCSLDMRRVVIHVYSVVSLNLKACTVCRG